MVKNINIAVDDGNYDELKKAKGKKSWHDFILTLILTDKKECEKKK